MRAIGSEVEVEGAGAGDRYENSREMRKSSVKRCNSVDSETWQEIRCLRVCA